MQHLHHPDTGGSLTCHACGTPDDLRACSPGDSSERNPAIVSLFTRKPKPLNVDVQVRCWCSACWTRAYAHLGD